MPKKQKEPTIEDIVAEIRKDFARWESVKKNGAGDPTWGDGTNLNIVRRHILIGQDRLKEFCKKTGAKKCPIEARLKVPKTYGENYMVPGQKRAMPTMVEIEARKESPKAK